MSGKRITDHQVKLYMSKRKHYNQAIAAAKAGISERSARRIDKGEWPPSTKRHWRTRKDPLDKVWESIVVPLLQQDLDNALTPFALFEHLCEFHGESFKPSYRRTLERRVAQWRQLHGGSKDVVFLQRHEFGQLGIADFTHINSLVTIANKPLEHRLFHFRLPASGWAFFQVVYGGESFAALSTGLQNAFHAAGGVPYKVRTDSLSAAYKNNSTQETFTERYAQLAQHYHFQATRNNQGIAHENGAIESVLV